AVVDYRALVGGDLVAHAAGIIGTAAAVEIAFQAVADGLVQQHARPARPQHHRHAACRRRLGGQAHQCPAYGLARILGHAVDVVVEPAVIDARAAAGAGGFGAAV